MDVAPWPPRTRLRHRRVDDGGTVDYWVGIAIVLGTGAYASFDFWRQFQSDQRKALTGIISIAALCGAFIWYSYVRAPIIININVLTVNYTPGTDILGLRWKQGYFPVYITIENPTDKEYSNF